jgi:hypothetical protein
MGFCLAVVVLVVHPLWWVTVGGRRTLAPGWWLVSGLAWWAVTWWLWGVGRYWEGWVCNALAVLYVAEALRRGDRMTVWIGRLSKRSSSRPPTA